ncbi:hypothetical protein GCM10027413_24480 [Conyzicola nivalis]|uniref:Uncharacterized protein n=1 Tax=Conyzicola nivalis TaxID=1477021 RepID=A0A916SCC3_9MICO|nr:hypothetical protein [Conyzicola nivalis]GGA91038.1 hypothetical protein GCM10010979_02140 [Conyzicola nivalis]
MVGDALFTDFKRRYRPLSTELAQSVSQIFRDIDTAETPDDLAAFENPHLEATISAYRRPEPSIGQLRRADSRLDGYRRTDEPGVRVPTLKQWVALEVFGDERLLDFWPDRAQHLTPLDVKSDGTIMDASSTWGSDFNDAADGGWPEWVVGNPGPGFGADGSEKHLYTHVFLSEEDEKEALFGKLDIQGVFLNKQRALEPFVAAIAEQTVAFYEKQLPESIADAVGRRRARLAARAAVTRQLSFPGGWKIDSLRLESSASADSAPKPAKAAASPTVTLPSRVKLDPASFNDVQRTIRVWADSVERYPRTFAGLNEDRLSDLLAATLNATLPDAQREVFTRKGKSDIFIKADVLSSGSGPATVFICESKWARSKKLVQEALNPQLFGYMNTHDTAAVLMLLLPQSDKVASVHTQLERLREVEGYSGEVEGAVEGWPILKYKNEERAVSICVALIHLPEGKAEGAPVDRYGHVIES